MATTTLSARWTAEDLTKAQNFIDQDANKTAQGLQELFDCVAQPVFAAYKIADALGDNGSKFFEGTLYESDPALGVYFIKEHLNSLRKRSNATDYSPFYYPIVVEVEVNPDGATDADRWIPVTELTGRDVFADGMIFLPVLRLLPEGQRNWEWSGTPFASNLVARKIRFSCVIYGDTRLHASAYQPGLGSPAIGGNFGTPFSSNLDTDAFVQGYRRAEMIDSRLYAHWMRTAKSKPIPASSPGVSNSGSYVAQTFGANLLMRNDLPKALAHAKRTQWERGILKKSGQMEYIGRMPCFDAGATISKFQRADGSFAVTGNAVVAGVEYTSTENESKAIVYLG